VIDGQRPCIGRVDVLHVDGWGLRTAKVAPDVVAGSRVLSDAVVGDRCTIRPRAEVKQGARLGEGCRVGDEAVVGRGAVLGPGCIIGEGCGVGTGARLEAGVRLLERTRLPMRDPVPAMVGAIFLYYPGTNLASPLVIGPASLLGLVVFKLPNLWK
jgi:NDP-sugar pyrophosphorylase family protein